VRSLFQARFERDEEAVGASYAVYHQGKKVPPLLPLIFASVVYRFRACVRVGTHVRGLTVTARHIINGSRVFCRW
jgi:hypothetical protein